MAVDAEQFPIAAVRGIVVVVVVLMVDGQFPKPFAGKLPATARTNPWEELQCPLAIGLLKFFPSASGLGDDLFEVGAIG